MLYSPHQSIVRNYNFIISKAAPHKKERKKLNNIKKTFIKASWRAINYIKHLHKRKPGINKLHREKKQYDSIWLDAYKS